MISVDIQPFETVEYDDGCGPRERWLHAADELDRFYGRI